MLSPLIFPDVGTSQVWLSNEPSAPMAMLQLRVRPLTVKRNENLLSLIVSPLKRFCPVLGKHCVDTPTHLPSKEAFVPFACGQAVVAPSNVEQAARMAN